MSGEVVYVPPQPAHECQPGHLTGQGEAILPVGTVWRCGKCGSWWRLDPIGRSGHASRWRRLRGIRLWWWKRHHGGAP